MKKWSFGVVLFLLLTGCVQDQDQTKISALKVEENDKTLFQRLISQKPSELPYVKSEEKISVALPDSSSSRYQVQDLILNEDGTSKFASSEPFPVTAEAKKGIVTFTVPMNPLTAYSSDSTDHEPGNIIRGFKLINEDDNKTFAFVLRTDAK
ncbi:hypothetical protein [Saccharibacillus sp. JS10]|uniref:hypothetical protein n=1 Tax=Saccharibacillus sp. JS10 TaxID=2950552 RepID=UPI00210CA190|nr:hypothetical protein [Saccharibacillus sp. JS10]MCQ4088328.1 hypothetical protein [Saccharibacillus sp. JS10]